MSFQYVGKSATGGRVYKAELLSVGSKVKRTVGGKTRKGTITAVEQRELNNGKSAWGYRIKFDDDESGDRPYWYAAKGDYISPA